MDLKTPEFSTTEADDFVIGDLRDPELVRDVAAQPFDEVYQLAADMGGAGFIFTGENDADIMHNSAMINLNVVEASVKAGVNKIFYSSILRVNPVIRHHVLKRLLVFSPHNNFQNFKSLKFISKCF